MAAAIGHDHRMRRARWVWLAGLVVAEAANALTPAEVFDKAKDSILVVMVFDENTELRALGSGVVLPSGRIATNCHVIEDGTYFRVGRSNQFVSANLYAANSEKDICLLTPNRSIGKSAIIRDTQTLRVGERVYAIGAPEGLELSLSEGLVSQLRGGLIQTSAPICWCRS